MSTPLARERCGNTESWAAVAIAAVAITVSGRMHLIVFGVARCAIVSDSVTSGLSLGGLAVSREGRSVNEVREGFKFWVAVRY